MAFHGAQLVTCVRSGLDAYAQVVRHRLAFRSADVEDAPGLPRGALSEIFQSSLSNALGDAVDTQIDALWNLTNRVLHFVDGAGPLDALDAANMFSDWYRTYFVSIAELRANRQRVLDNFPTLDAASFSANWDALCAVILQTFLCGHFEIAASLLEAALTVGRQREGAFLSATEEECMSDVLRLLSINYRTHDEFLDWKQVANELVADARYVLEPRTGSGSAAALSLKDLALTLLLIMRGDAVKVAECCAELGVDAIGFAAALCSVISPFSNLAEVHAVLVTAAQQNGGGSATATNSSSSSGGGAGGAQLLQPWYLSVATGVLHCSSPSELILAMEHLGKKAAHSLEHLDAEDKQKALRRFSAAYMAAHVADLCLPSIIPQVADAQLLYVRNQLVVDYVTTFAHEAFVTNTAFVYLASSPLIDVSKMYQLCVDVVCAQVSNAASQQRYKEFEQTMATYAASRSSFQMALRRSIRHVIGGGSRALESWLVAFDETVLACGMLVREAYVGGQWAAGHFAEGLWEAIEGRQTGFVYTAIADELASPNALQSELLRTVGWSVQYGFICLASCSTELALTLRIVAAFADVAEVASSLPAKSAALSVAQRLSSIAIVLRQGLEFIHAAVACRLVRVALSELPSSSSDGGGGSVATLGGPVDFLVALNAAVNELHLRTRNGGARAVEEQVKPETLDDLRKVVLMRLATVR